MSTAFRTNARPPKGVPPRPGAVPRPAQSQVRDRINPGVPARSAPLSAAHRKLQDRKLQDRRLENFRSQNPRTQVRQLPIQQSLPLWLRVLMLMQRSSTAIAAVLVLAMLVVYGSTVYTQQLWSKEYRKLKTSQRHERQLVSASEALKTQAAQQAERPGAGLVPQTPADLLFVQPSALRPQQSLNAIAPPPTAPVAPPAGY
jgi:hypothetical protein